ncbi:MAG: tRNA pseudouridine(13) synthase TruD [Candidatus Diapherotrites archaeon]|nr:tRNA pseudouridine(13) synthase TruD [Candidatus Diapherotrites archaeon]
MNWEREIGIEKYLSEGRCKGYIKEYPEDFVVEEEGPLGKAELKILKGEKAEKEPRGGGEYLHVVLEKRDWDLNDLIREIARRLKIGRDRISFAGTKDKYALTAQWISLWRVKWSELSSLSIKDAAFHSPIYRKRKLRRGDLFGNWFQVRIRGCTPGEVPELFLNYFGHQRFGSYRFVSHLIGKELLRENYEGALWTYLTHTSPWEPEETRAARERLKKERDLRAALEYFPARLRKEGALIQRYLETGDPRRAMFSLPKNLISLFLHAYQSFLFNKMLSRRVDEEVPDLGETGIVPGYLSRFSEGLQGKVEREVLDEEGVDLSLFKRWKRFGTQGDRRKLIERVRNLSQRGSTLSFFLEKGTYATSYLREILKPESPVGFVFSRRKVSERRE